VCSDGRCAATAASTAAWVGARAARAAASEAESALSFGVGLARPLLVVGGVAGVRNAVGKGRCSRLARMMKACGAVVLSSRSAVRY